MKKIGITIVLIVILLLGTTTFSGAVEQFNDNRIFVVNNNMSINESKEELYQDIFMTMLNPYIEKAVYDYYGKPYTVGPYANILSI